MTTPKPIDQLTLEELRVECAEAMGWRKEVFGTLVQDCRWYKPDGTKTAGDPPNYPADANAALTLAHALAEKGWRYHIFTIANGDTAAVFFKTEDSQWNQPATAAGPHAFAMALSRAYLAVVRARKEQQG